MLRFWSKTVVRTTLSILLAAASAVAQDTESFSFALFGDMPYTATTSETDLALVRYKRLIAHMNTFDLGFGIHIGDIKAGNTRCDDVVYSNNLALFNTFRAPIIYTPGDNEWTDCHRLNNGNLAPLDRLALIRSTFYPTKLSLGQYPIELKRQPGYPENIRYKMSKVLVVTLHMTGSNNNLEQKISELVAGAPRNNPYYDSDVEYTARNAANVAWLDEQLQYAAEHPTIQGVVVAFQANPFERFLEPLSASNNNAYTRSGFADVVAKLREKTLLLQTLGKAVIGVHGDTHTMRISQPLTTTYPGCDPANITTCVALPVGGTTITNFTRVEVFAQANVHWIKVRYEKDNPNVFVIEPMFVPGN